MISLASRIKKIIIKKLKVSDTENRLVVARGGCVGRSVSKWQSVSKATRPPDIK